MVRLRGIRLLFVLVLGATSVAACSSSSKSSSGGGVSASSGSGTTINVVVSDTKGTDGPMTLVPTPATAPSGSVTFVVKNTGTVDHEVVVLKTDTAFDQLPVGKPEADKVDEATSVGETGDPALKPGESRSFTVKNMKSGKYVLVCNIAKHYAMGMRAAFSVS